MKDEDLKKELTDYWESVIVKNTKEQLADLVQFARLRKEGKKRDKGAGKGQRAKAKAKGEPQPPAAKMRNSSGSPLAEEKNEDEDDEYMSAQETPSGMRILQFRVGDKQIADMVTKALKQMKWERKRGAAPRSALERVCQQYLQDMGKNKIKK